MDTKCNCIRFCCYLSNFFLISCLFIIVKYCVLFGRFDGCIRTMHPSHIVHTIHTICTFCVCILFFSLLSLAPRRKPLNREKVQKVKREWTLPNASIRLRSFPFIVVVPFQSNSNSTISAATMAMAFGDQTEELTIWLNTRFTWMSY